MPRSCHRQSYLGILGHLINSSPIAPVNIPHPRLEFTHWSLFPFRKRKKKEKRKKKKDIGLVTACNSDLSVGVW
jgi:hypothetical protein